MVPSDSDDERDLPDGPGTTNIPPTIYVTKFHPNTRREAIEWLLEKIEAKQKYGGAELFVRSEPQTQLQGVIVHISATKIKLLEVAEAIELQKKTSSNLVQEFSVRELDQFLYGGKTLDTVLTPSEREFCVRHELEGIRAKPEDSYVPGYPEIKMYPGQSVVDVYLREELITDFYPLHDRHILEDLGNRWYKSILNGASLDYILSPLWPSMFRNKKMDQEDKNLEKETLLDEIRCYFGESVAMYFGFLGFYTLTLVAPALMGLLQMVMSVDTVLEHTFFAAFNLVWVTVFLELWKRKCSELSYSWGTLDRTGPPMPRPNYRGDMRQNPITGRFEPYYPPWKTQCKLYLVSVPVVFLCMLGALWLMVVAFWAEEQLIDWKRMYGPTVGFFLNFPSAIYAAIVWLINYHYNMLAALLTEWENHRTVEDYDWHRMSKLVAFKFVNNFSSFFYIAFYIQNMDMLCSQVATMLIVTQMINHFKEALLPFYVKKLYRQNLFYTKPSSFGPSKNYQKPVYVIRMFFYTPLIILVDSIGHKLNPIRIIENFLLFESLLQQMKTHPMTKYFFSEPVRLVENCPTEEDSVPVLSLDAKDPRIIQAKEEAQLDSYEGVYEDFLEMFLQFGYVFLFSAVYPMAAFWAILNNILELKTDAFKLCKLYRRPQSKKVRDIGAWQQAFELIGAVAVITNCALLCLSPRLRPLAPTASPIEWVLIFVGFEHILLAIKMALVRCFSDQPQWVRDAVDRVAFHAKMALRNERGKKTRRHLSRRFRSVHGVPRSGSRSRATTPVAQNGGLRHRSSTDYINRE